MRRQRTMAVKNKKKTKQAKKVRKATSQQRRGTGKSGKSKQPRKSPPAVEEANTDSPSLL
jgi:hypothetical protein